MTIAPYIRLLFSFNLLLVLATGCIPMKKQLLLQDVSKPTIKERQNVDTTLTLATFEYRLKPGDIISIDILSITQGMYSLQSISAQGTESSNGGQVASQSGYIINDSGYVDVPVIGLMKLEMLTLNEAKNVVQIKANEYLNNVSVIVRLLNFNVNFLGEITRRGRLNSPEAKLTLIEGLSLAGGPTEYANLEKIKIIRTEGNKTRIHYVDISNQNTITHTDFYLMPNDVVVLEPLRVKNFNTYTKANITLAASLLASVILITNFINILTR